MADEEERLRRIVREEIAASLPAFFKEVIAELIVARVINGPGGRLVRRNVDPELSAKRSQAAKAMWAKVKGQISTAPPAPPITKPRASNKPRPGNGADSTAPLQLASNEQASEQATLQPPTAKAFLAYAGAYRMRYGEFPVRNAKTNAHLKQLVDRLGAPEAPPVAEYYLTLTDKLYAGSGHALSLLVRDAEKLRTMWKQGASPTTGAPAAPAKPWWDGPWSALEAQGDELGIPAEENPQIYRAMVLRAAYKAGRLPEDVARKLGVRVDDA